MSDALSADFKPEPYWWEDVPRRGAAEHPLPDETDVVIVGSGYAGLSCAIELARQGRSVTVLEARSLGFGASSRSVGMIGGRLRQSFPCCRAASDLQRRASFSRRRPGPIAGS